MRHTSACIALSLAVAGLPVPASAATFVFSSPLAPEVSGATGSGLVTVTYNDVAHTLDITASWSGLSGATTVAHIHCCTASPGVGFAGIAATPPTLPGFPTGLGEGSYSLTGLDLTSNATYSPAFLTASGGSAALAEQRLFQNMLSRQAYFNVHSSTFGGGEIRGFLALVPEPATWAMLIAGFGWVGGMMRRRHVGAKIAWNRRRRIA